MLSGTYLNDANPDYSKALEHNSLMLADRTLLPNERHRGLLDRATILLHLGRLGECLATLDEIPESALSEAEAMVIRAQVLMREGRRASAHHDRSRGQVSRSGQTAPPGRQPRHAGRSSERSGDVLDRRVLPEGGRRPAAWSQLDRTKRTYPGTLEEVAADFRLAELARKLGQDVEGLAAYQQVLGSVADSRAMNNRWLTLDELRQGTLGAYRAYLDAGKFHTAVALAKCFYPTFPRTRTLELVGEAYRAWGSQCLAESQRLPPSEAELLAAKGREQFRRAGSVYQHLADLRITTREYPEDLWASAESYLAGASYTRAAEMFQEYLKNQSRVRRPRALLGLGEARLALGQWDDALAALKQCVDFYPSDAAAFRARLIASKAFAEKGDNAQAQRLLERTFKATCLRRRARNGAKASSCWGACYMLKARRRSGHPA